MDEEEAADCRLEIFEDFIRSCPECQERKVSITPFSLLFVDFELLHCRTKSRQAASGWPGLQGKY